MRINKCKLFYLIIDNNIFNIVFNIIIFKYNYKINNVKINKYNIIYIIIDNKIFNIVFLNIIYKLIIILFKIDKYNIK